jgi:hypothetical protein
MSNIDSKLCIFPLLSLDNNNLDMFLFNGNDWNKITHSNIETVNILNHKIIKDITNRRFSDSSSIVGENNDLLEYKFLDVMCYRKCLVFLVLQFSHITKKYRGLAYGLDILLHSGQGNSLETLVSSNSFKKDMKDIFEFEIQNIDLSKFSSSFRNSWNGQIIFHI